jgi:hypothetical protein
MIAPFEGLVKHFVEAETAITNSSHGPVALTSGNIDATMQDEPARCERSYEGKAECAFQINCSPGIAGIVPRLGC